MPRLVSLTLLSVLVLPAAALVYLLVVVIGSDRLGYQSRFVVWLSADAVAFAMVVAWWIVLWRRSIEWTAWMVSATLLAVGGSLLLGMFAGGATDQAVDDEEFSLFIAGGTSVVAWLVSACWLWRRGGRMVGTGGDGGGTAGGAIVFCPKCGYALNGLREARCPECGEVYTLDVLLRQQPSFGMGSDLQESRSPDQRV